jgi:hypothetical protein
MACGCKKHGGDQRFRWTGLDAEGNTLVVVYDTEIQAKAKVLRKGGSYEPVGG